MRDRNIINLSSRLSTQKLPLIKGGFIRLAGGVEDWNRIAEGRKSTFLKRTGLFRLLYQNGAIDPSETS